MIMIMTNCDNQHRNDDHHMIGSMTACRNNRNDRNDNDHDNDNDSGSDSDNDTGTRKYDLIGEACQRSSPREVPGTYVGPVRQSD